MGASRRKSNAVLVPNLGIYKDRPSIAIDPRGLEDCKNIRIKNGEILRDNMGWTTFMTRNLTNPVTLIDQFFLSTGSRILIFGTTKDLYQYDESAEDVLYINPREESGSVIASIGETAVFGSATGWTSTAAAGDEIFIGATSVVSVDAHWHEISAIVSNGEITLTSARGSATASDVDYTIRKRFTGDVKNFWVADTYQNVVTASSGTEDQWFATNGVDLPVFWNGSDLSVKSMTSAIDSSLGFTAECLTVHKEMLIFFNVTEAGTTKSTTMKYSDIGNPIDFATGLAGEAVVYDPGGDHGEINAVHPLGDNLVVYGRRNITLAQFVGTPVDFIFRTVINGTGLIAGRAIVDFGDHHEFMGQVSQYQFNGISIKEIGSQVWRETLRTISPNRLDLFHAHMDEENGEVLWIAPLTTDTGSEVSAQPMTSFTEHYLEEVGDNPAPYTIRDLPATATGNFRRQDTLKFSDLTDTWAEQNIRWNDRFFQATFPFNLFGDEDGNVFILGEIDSQNGTDISSFATFGLRPVVDGIHKGIVKRVYAFTEALPAASHNLGINVLTTNQANGTTVAQSSLDYDLTHSDSNNHFVSPFVAGRYYQIKITVDGAGKPFNFAGYDTEIVRGGKR